MIEQVGIEKIFCAVQELITRLKMKIREHEKW